MVDYLQLMQVPGQGSRVEEISEISRMLKALAKEMSVPVVALILVDGAFIMLVLRPLISTAPGLLLAYMAAVAITIGYAASGWHGDNFPRYFAPPFVILPLVFAALWLRFKDVITPPAGWSVLAAAVIGLWANYQFLAASHNSQVALGDLRDEFLVESLSVLRIEIVAVAFGWKPRVAIGRDDEMAGHAFSSWGAPGNQVDVRGAIASARKSAA